MLGLGESRHDAAGAEPVGDAVIGGTSAGAVLLGRWVIATRMVVSPFLILERS